jgi:hypothetical protein
MVDTVSNSNMGMKVKSVAIELDGGNPNDGLRT